MALALSLFAAGSEAATVEDLYQAQTILTGQGEEGRPQGFADCLKDVLAKVSGDPLLLDDPRVAALAPQAATLVRIPLSRPHGGAAGA